MPNPMPPNPNPPMPKPPSKPKAFRFPFLWLLRWRMIAPLVPSISNVPTSFSSALALFVVMRLAAVGISGVRSDEKMFSAVITLTCSSVCAGERCIAVAGSGEGFTEVATRGLGVSFVLFSVVDTRAGIVSSFSVRHLMTSPAARMASMTLMAMRIDFMMTAPVLRG